MEGSMNKVIVGMMAVLLLGVSAVWAQETNTPASSQIQAAPVEVGNKTCPVSGNKVGEMGPPIKYTYNGKVYNLCCPMCIKSFKGDPEKYSKIADDDAAKNGQYEDKK
jgi:YHS domain-containing protein